MSYITPKRKARKDRKKAKNLNTDITKNLFLTDNFGTVPFGDYNSSNKKTKKNTCEKNTHLFGGFARFAALRFSFSH